MKKTIILLSAFLMVFVFVSGNFAQEKNKVTKQVTKNVDKNKIFNTVCPVSGEPVDQKITYTYKNVTYALCCKTCLAKFKKDPEKFVSRLSDDGKTIKKK